VSKGRESSDVEGRGTRLRAFVLMLAGLAAADIRAQEGRVPDLVTDRPDQTESSVVIPPRTVQVEAGVLRTGDAEGGERTDVTAAPGTLVRYGLLSRLELRLAWTGWIEEESRGASGQSRVTGTADPELGFKVALTPARGGRPELALLAHVSLPLGGNAVGSPRADPSVRLLATHTLSERVGLGWNLGWEAASSEGAMGEVETRGRFVYTTSLGFDLAERWGAFFEIFGDLPASDPAPAAHSLDGGVTFLVAPRVQLDLAAGVGLDRDAPDRFVGFGVSFRLPR